MSPSENPLAKALGYGEKESSGPLSISSSLPATVSNTQHPDSDSNEPRSPSPTEENINGENQTDSIASVNSAAGASKMEPTDTAVAPAAAAAAEMNTDLVKIIMRTMCDMITGDDGDETNVKAAGISGIGGSSRVLLLRAGAAGAVVVTARTHIGRKNP
jgi:hypothetical protein